MKITETVIKKVNSQDLTLNMNEVSDGLKIVAETILDHLGYNKHAFAKFDGFNLVTSDTNELIYTFEYFNQENATKGILNILTENGRKFDIQLNIE